jgi:chromosome partitioning protein
VASYIRAYSGLYSRLVRPASDCLVRLYRALPPEVTAFALYRSLYVNSYGRQYMTATTVSNLDRTVLVANQKGGVWKTSSGAALGSRVARQERRVLLVDADQQGNLSKADLGVEGDRGRNLAMGLQYAHPLEPVRDVRPGLDLVPGGQILSAINAVAGSAVDLDLAGNLARVLGDLCAREHYALVLIDSGPGDAPVLDALLRTARHLLVPTASDEASMDGVDLLAQRYLRARSQGAAVSLLGVVLVAVNPRATARNAAVLTEVAQLLEGSGANAFSTTLRTDQAAAIDLRARHLTPTELVEANKAAKSSRLRSLGRGGAEKDGLWSRDASGLASDYVALAKEVLIRIAATVVSRSTTGAAS